MHETITFLDVTSFICKLIDVYNCTQICMNPCTSYLMQFFAFLTTFSVVDAPCVQMMTPKLKKLLPLVKHFFIQQGAPK